MPRQIKPYEKNAKKHPDKQLKQIAASLREFGWQQPIVVDENDVIIVGHGRWAAYSKYPEGIDEPRIETATLNEQQAAAYRLADNKLNESDWDMDLVVEELKELDLHMVDLTGFDRDLVIEDDDRDDDVPDVPDEARATVGDVFEPGPHRIMCGDSTSLEDVQKLMDGNKADMLFTDPPYNVDYSDKGKNTGEGILNDKMSDDAFLQFLTDNFKATKEVIKSSAPCYIFHSHKTAYDFERALRDTGFVIDTQLIWNKPSAGLGANDYRTKHEPFFYASLGDKDFYGDRTGTTVWKIPADPAKALQWMTKEMEYQESGNTTIWSMKRSNVNEYVHPTQKPVELPVTAMTKSSKEEDIVLDLFLGSGTTLISAEKANRVCYGMELDPKYIDVIITRWCDYTGNGSIKLNGIEIIWQENDNAQA